jgi:diguanylate cyclase (GGDEF)-like protein
MGGTHACLDAEGALMSDNETPLPNPERDDAPASALPAEPQIADDDFQATTQPSSGGDGPGRLKRLVLRRKSAWAAVAVLCVAAGTAGSVLGAHAVARTDATKARVAFPRTSAGIALTLKLAIQREEELGVSASTFFAEKPQASAAEFRAWATWAQTLRRYPELERIGFIALVRAPELAVFEARSTGHAPKPLASSSALPNVGGFRIVPPGKRSYYCFATAELAGTPVKNQSPGTDYCAPTHGPQPSRSSALSSYATASTGRNQALAVVTPVYSGSARPSTSTSRRGAFVGWLREALLPGIVLGEALREHPGYAVHLRYRAGSSSVVFNSGTPQPGAQTQTISLHNGWTVRSFGPSPAGAGTLEDGSALALLIVGSLLSAVLGLLVFFLGGGLGGGRSRALDPEPSELVHEDLYDGLTGLPNRALMLDRAERMLARATRQSGLLVGALFIDIDWFKNVNDKLGQAAGDQLLTIVGQRLEGVVRGHDTVGRLGGDEFVVLVESAARGVRLDTLARRVIEALHQPVELDGFGLSLSLTASIGVAFGRYETPDDLLRDALLALTAAKTAGRNRYTLFNANMRSVIEGRGTLGAELNAALGDKQLFLLYQPIYDLATRKVVGLEALIRWRHPAQGVLPPDDFIPLAEESGLIVPIGRWALEEACGRAAEWNVAGHRVGISVKVSPYQLNRDGFATDVRRALQQSGIEPSLLTLEISETTVMRDVAAAAARLGEIKQLGVRVAIDDFGASGSTYHSDLRQMPLDFLKVDRNSLNASDDEAYRSWLLEAILIVGRDLSVPVIATGVETYEQMTTLQTMGCPMAQGFFMGKPTPADALESVFDADFPTAPATSTEAVT